LTQFGFDMHDVIANTEEERLLGVSLTGIYDHPILGDKDRARLPALLGDLRSIAASTNHKLASQLGIPPSAAITCVKPSGTVSQLCDTASGLHPRHSKHYLRTTRIDKKDPLYSFMKDKGFYIEDDVMRPADTGVVYFPQSAPIGAKTRDDITALDHLALWLIYQRHWCDHKPSVTINVKDHEWVDVAAWVYKHFDEVSGISFLPYDGGTYQQAPYQELTPNQIADWEWLHPVPTVDWTELRNYETEDNTTGTQEYACVGGQCELK
jgi:ribonucleoside-diphosphate reductase alpha chain